MLLCLFHTLELSHGLPDDSMVGMSPALLYPACKAIAPDLAAISIDKDFDDIAPNIS